MSIIQKSQIFLEYDKILSELSTFAKTNQSARLCLDLTPYIKFEDIEQEIKYTKEAKDILDFDKDIPIENIINFTKLKQTNEYYTEEELIDIAKTLKTFRLVHNFLKNNLILGADLNKLADLLFCDKSLEDKIFDTFDSNNIVKHDANETLNGLYSSLKDTETLLKQKVQELINSKDFQTHLQENIYTMRDDRIVFQVKASSKSKVNGIVHDVSATNRTFYIEPAQIVPLNNKIRELKSKIYAEVIRILTNLSGEVRKNIDNLINSEQIVSLIDFHFAKARYAVKINATQPFLSQEKILKFDLMRHPLLINHAENIVENDFYIGKDFKSMIITGSNTGGKTVTLKTVGLFVLMTKSGMFLPCAEAHVYPFTKILADIGDEQSILQNLSTFSSHIKNVIEILNISDNDSLVLIDELCAGTDPQEGAILAEIFLKELAKKDVVCLTSTHYGELKTLEFSDNYFKNASVEFDTESLKPTYKLIIGIPGLSNAISISANLGLRADLVEEAKKLLYTQRDPSVIAVEKMQNTQQMLDSNLKEAKELNEKADELKNYYEKELNQHKKEKQKTLKFIKDKFDNELNNAKDEIKDILNELRRDKSEKIARRSYARLAKLEKDYKDNLQTLEEKENYQEINWNNAKINDKVMIKELNQDVLILSLPDKNDNLYIQMGTIKTKVKKDRLAVYNSDLAKKTYLPNIKKENFTLKKYDISSTLDLRGERAEDALDKLENYLDKASLANLTPVYIIHGHGTGVLKSVVREFVSTSPYVAKFRIGEEAEGGDGVCVIDLK